MINIRNNPLIFILWGLVLAVAITSTIFYVFFGADKIEQAGIGGGTYELADHNGERFGPDDLVGHPSMLFFGFTHCPEVCPTTMVEMQYWFAQLGDDAADLKGYFVTVDPERDTPELIKGYVDWVSPRMVGVTGERAEIDKMIAAWRVLAERVELDDGDYTMNHTASVFLLDSNGQFVGTISYGESAEVAIGKIRNLLTRT